MKGKIDYEQTSMAKQQICHNPWGDFLSAVRDICV